MIEKSGKNLICLSLDHVKLISVWKLLFRMSVKPLQMEQMAVSGYAEEPSLVADRMRLVFATLEV